MSSRFYQFTSPQFAIQLPLMQHFDVARRGKSRKVGVVPRLSRFRGEVQAKLVHVSCAYCDRNGGERSQDVSVGIGCFLPVFFIFFELRIFLKKYLPPHNHERHVRETMGRETKCRDDSPYFANTPEEHPSTTWSLLDTSL